VGSADWSGTAGPSAAPAIRDGVISRPALVALLAQAGRTTVVSAPAGSGKTLLLRSWIGERGLTKRAAWVAVRDGERDPQRFWLSVLGALRDTAAGSALVRPLTAAPGLDGWALVERLLADLGALEDQVWLVIDDVHELHSDEALNQLELLLMRAPARLRFVLATRRDLRLGLHRLRLEGDLTEIRAADLRFTLEEARALFDAAGISLSESALGLLYQRTEGWAAGLRLAALSLEGHEDPDRFASEFSGSERTVAEYLMAEVLERQPEPVQRLLLRTSVLEQVNGELADMLTCASGGERILRQLEQAGAFVTAVDAGRSWFRYHRLFADLLRLELRGSGQAELPALHAAAAGWYAEHGFPLSAVRHAQAAQDWALAARVLCDHWVGLVLDGQGSAVRDVLAEFPVSVLTADPELAALMAGEELVRGTLEDAEAYLALSARGSASVPASRRDQFRVILAVVRMRSARQRGDPQAVAEQARLLLAPAGDADRARLGEADPARLVLAEDLRALALISLGVAELWTVRFVEADRHLEEGIALAHRIRRPYLELTGLAHWAQLTSWRSFQWGAQRSGEAIDLAARHGWTEEPITGIAYVALGTVLVAQGRLKEGDSWLARAERTIRAEVEPAAGVRLYYARALLEFVNGRADAALSAFRAAERLAQMYEADHSLTRRLRSHALQALVRTGGTRQAERALAEMDGPERDTAEMRNALATLRLAQDDPKAATIALAPVIDGAVSPVNAQFWQAQTWLLEAIARDGLGDAGAAGRAVEHALDLAEPEGLLLPFLLDPVPGLLEHHRRQGTAHATLVAEILNVLAERKPSALSAEATRDTGGGWSLCEALSQSEIRVLRYLPTNLTVPEIADHLYLSVNTVRTHTRHIYDKLGAHRRHEAVEQARALGLLAPPPRRP
jgi:LuxR family transcriptional regulator, maltose regulon positive regulatory protein